MKKTLKVMEKAKSAAQTVKERCWGFNIVLEEKQEIPNRYDGQPSEDKFEEVVKRLEYADLWRNPGTLKKNDVLRVDMQGHIPEEGREGKIYNIQAQVNGIRGNSTVAATLVSDSIMVADPPNQLGVLRKVQKALRKSLSSGHIYSAHLKN